MCTIYVNISKILEDHQDKCEKQGKFVEAEMAKQKAAQFKKMEEEKLLNEAKARHAEQKEQLEIEQKEELDKFNEAWDLEFYALNNKFSEMEMKLKVTHDEELRNQLEELNQKYNEVPKPSVELLSLHKTLDQLVKVKEYIYVIILVILMLIIHRSR